MTTPNGSETMGEPAAVGRRKADAIPVLHLAGEIDPSNAATIFAPVTRDATGGALVVDLTAVTFIDSSGLRALIVLGDRRVMHVVAPRGGAPRRLLELTGLVDVLQTFETVGAAVQAFVTD
jgi:anti-anti-sigma factor